MGGEEESFSFLLNMQLSALPYEGLHCNDERVVEILLVFELLYYNVSELGGVPYLCSSLQ